MTQRTDVARHFVDSISLCLSVHVNG